MLSFGTTRRHERKFVGCFNSQIELAVGLYAFVLCVNQASACRLDHAIEFLPRGSLDLESPDLYEIVELILAP
jgi:hypothetical protein